MNSKRYKNHQRKPIYVFAFLLILFHGMVKSQELEIPLPEEMYKNKLDNGITYYIRENHEPKNHAELLLVVKAGSLQETDQQLGLAHFTEHMAFNGTKSFPKNELIDYLEEAGVRFGADLNAYTSFEETVYQLPLSTEKEELLESGFKILSEWAGGINFENEEIDAERGIIIEEERQRGKNMAERMRKKILPIYLKDSRYLDRIPIGSPEIIKNFNYKTLKDYYNKWYAPNLQAVIAVGDFDPDKVEKYIQKYFGNLKARENQSVPKSYLIPNNEKPIAAIATDPEFPHTILSIAIKHDQKTIKTNEDFYNSILRSAAISMLSSRISELIQSGTTPLLNAGVSYDPYQGGMGALNAFNVQLIPKDPELLEQATKRLMDEINRMVQYGFTAPELERVKEKFLNIVQRSHLEKDKTSSSVYLGQAKENFLSDQAIIGSDYSLSFYEKHLPQITLEEVNAVARDFFSEYNQVIVLQAPEKEDGNLPNKETLIEWVNLKRDVDQYKEALTDSKIIKDSLTSGKIKGSKTFNTIGVKEYRLSNGATVVLKNTDFKNDQILFHAFSPGGISHSQKEQVFSSRIADNLIGMSGFGTYSPVELNKILSGKSLSVSPYIGTYNEGLKGSSAPEDLETTLQVIHQYFSKPRKDSIAFSRLMDNLKVKIRSKGSNPMAVFQDTINSVMRGKSIWTQPLDTNSIKLVSMDQAFDFYKERFENAGDFTFVFVGNLKEEKILPLIEKYIGSLPGTDRRENFKDIGIQPIKGNVQKTVYRGLEEKAIVVLAMHGDYNYSAENNLKLKAIESVLSEKLLKRLRERESGVYSPSVGLSYSKRPNPYYVISVNFSCDPSRVDELIAATEEEIADLQANGPSKQEIQKFIAQQSNQHKLRVRSNSYWISYLKNFYEDEMEDINFSNTYLSRLESLKEKNLKDSFQSFLGTDYMAELLLLPEK